ncbi:DNA helicase UvrD [Candidatus Woesearchaeota archaeon]|nr:DNA helicase UvrD [Candidatus Woesearchaeota archaeon]
MGERIISDLHIHGRFSRATSKQLDFVNLEKYARLKGINLLGTGDFTHPKWLGEIRSNLSEDGSGILKTGSGFHFMLTSEISLMYSQDGRGRKVHLVILAPDLGVVAQINEYLGKKGRLDYDGRPIFGKLPCDMFVDDMRRISTDIEVIAAHVWTPYFGLFGSMSGFDSVEDAFKDQSKHIHALETGLSSDPEMNWRLSKLDRYSLVSFSDLHSFWPWRLGREATIFDAKLDYKSILSAIRNKEIAETIEVDPNYGKYHFDGHRDCKVCLEPKDTVKHKGICPVCGKKLTIGVLNRVEQLADRPLGTKPEGAAPFRRLIPLSDMISALTGSAVSSQKVWKVYYDLIKRFGTELDVLLDAPEEELKKVVDGPLADSIILNRHGNIRILPGYDGEYGVPVLGEMPKRSEFRPKHIQKGLSDF